MRRFGKMKTSTPLQMLVGLDKEALLSSMSPAQVHAALRNSGSQLRTLRQRLLEQHRRDHEFVMTASEVVLQVVNDVEMPGGQLVEGQASDPQASVFRAAKVPDPPMTASDEQLNRGQPRAATPVRAKQAPAVIAAQAIDALRGTAGKNAVRVVAVGGRTGHFVDAVYIFFSNGKRLDYGGDGGAEVAPEVSKATLPRQGAAHHLLFYSPRHGSAHLLLFFRS